jgi:hypothetical protein
VSGWGGIKGWHFHTQPENIALSLPLQISYLLQLGGDPAVENEDGETPISVARFKARETET